MGGRLEELIALLDDHERLARHMERPPLVEDAVKSFPDAEGLFMKNVDAARVQQRDGFRGQIYCTAGTTLWPVYEAQR